MSHDTENERVYLDYDPEEWAAMSEEDRAQFLADFKEPYFEDLKLWHAEDLDRLSGNATREERDTWPNQAAWAAIYLDALNQIAADLPDENGIAVIMDTKRIPDQPPPSGCEELLLGLMLAPEIAQLKAYGLDPAAHLAEKISVKSMNMKKLTAAAGNAKRGGEAALGAAESPEAVLATMTYIEQQRFARIAQFEAQLAGG